MASSWSSSLTPGERSNPTAFVATPDSSISGWFLFGACAIKTSNNSITKQLQTKHYPDQYTLPPEAALTSGGGRYRQSASRHSVPGTGA